MPLPRLQLVELEDLAWWPRAIRDPATDYLNFMQERLALHEPMLPVLREALHDAGERRIVDLCSGGSGPLPALIDALRGEGVEATATLTDLYPNLGAFEAKARGAAGAIAFEHDPVNAMRVPRRLAGFRTLFNAFHHFRPRDAGAVLQDAVDAGQPIGVFEIPERTLFTVVGFVTAPLIVACATPFIRPFRWSRLLWTYLLPGVPLTCVWDGVVSQLRAYTPAELDAMAARLDAPGWRWTTGRRPIPRMPLHVTYLIGIPPRGNAARAVSARRSTTAGPARLRGRS